ncbi:MAG: Hpt domain-containing protein [bacterium]
MTPFTGSDNDAVLGEPPSTDPAALERLQRFGGGKLLREMIGLFMEAAPERIGAARAAVNASDAKATELALHSLKSSSAQLGALRMQRLSEQGETIARTGSLEGVDALVTGLEAEYPSIQAWLERARTAGNA